MILVSRAHENYTASFDSIFSIHQRMDHSPIRQTFELGKLITDH